MTVIMSLRNDAPSFSFGFASISNSGSDRSMTKQVFSHSSINAFASFTYFESDDPANSAVFVFRDDAGKTLMLSTTLKIASEMRALLNEAFTQMEQADAGSLAALLTVSAELGPKPN